MTAATLDAAWAKAEAALPEGWRIIGIRWGARGWTATYSTGLAWVSTEGNTPVAALHALAARIARGARAS